MTTVLFAALALVALWLFLTVPAAVLAGWVVRFGPGVLYALAALSFVRGSLGGALALGSAGYALRRWLGHSVQPMSASTGQRRGGGGGASTVRSAALEMELDHATGEMNGIVLAGRFEGLTLNEMPLDDLLALRSEVVGDDDSIALLDAYLDRRFPAWREAGQADAGAGQGGAAGSGAMDEKEAYQVLGLEPGASAAEIREAHRRLMKGAHPDGGGSTFLAAKINEAKDVLLRGHT